VQEGLAPAAVKFSLQGDFGLDVLSAGSPASQAISCDAAEVNGDTEEALGSGRSGLS
jgi:hypothetical protein